MLWSADLFRLLGHEPGSIRPSVQLLFASVDPRQRSFVRSTFLRTVGAGGEFDLEYSSPAGAGAVRHLRCQARPLYRASGVLIGYIGTVANVRQQHMAAEILRQTHTELSRVSRLLTMGELAASIAHEVNQPLTAIVANANAGLRWLQAERPNLKQARRSLTAIAGAATRAAEVIQRIRSMARRGTDVERKPVQVGTVIREVAELLRGEVRRHGALLRLHLGRELPQVHADPVQLQQVLLNLIVNGLEAMESAPSGSKALTIAARSYGDYLRIAVSDHGPGVPQQHVDRIFMPFFSTKPQGVGIGLSISRAIVEQHGGSIGVESPENGGATFQFTLPVPPPPA